MTGTPEEVVITRISINGLTSDQLEELQRAAQALNRVRAWIAGEPVAARSEFGRGYREALRDIADVIAAGSRKGVSGPQGASEAVDGDRDVREAARAPQGGSAGTGEAAA